MHSEFFPGGRGRIPEYWEAIAAEAISKYWLWREEFKLENDASLTLISLVPSMPSRFHQEIPNSDPIHAAHRWTSSQDFRVAQ